MPFEELVVLSHLRWDDVWQRPHHLISRVGRGHETWFVEEPMPLDGVDAPRLRRKRCGNVVRVWLEVPGPERHCDFGDPAAAAYASLLQKLLGARADRLAWIYTPMALDLATALRPSLVVYDVMDNLAAFADAPDGLADRHRVLLRQADVVFTGGRSLHRWVTSTRPTGTHMFASGVDVEHFARATDGGTRRARPVAGYVGVIDERVDLDLVARLADELPDWEIRMIGPVVKVDRAALPQATNLTYPGPKPYADLPAEMAQFDVAIMPFALNAATKSISPTKTLEYLAAGLPVVSTPIADVVADFGDVAHVHDSAGFSKACRDALAQRPPEVADLLDRYRWDTIAATMESLVLDCAAVATDDRETA